MGEQITEQSTRTHNLVFAEATAEAGAAVFIPHLSCIQNLPLMLPVTGQINVNYTRGVSGAK